VLDLHSLDNATIPNLKVQFESSNPGLVFKYTSSNNTLATQITDNTKNQGDYDGFITIDDSKTVYRIPVLIHVTKGTLEASQNNNQISFSINYPDKWSYAKISLMKAGSHDTKIVGITPQDSKTISINSAGEYWVEADIKVENQTDHAYKILSIDHITESYPDIEEFLRIPIKQAIIIFSILVIAVIVSLLKRR
jgi:minor extracellular serine protease Vpr